MENKNRIIPVLLGGDLNAYSVARMFFEARGVNSHVFARADLAISGLSRFTEMHVVKDLDDPNVAVSALIDFRKNQGDGDYLLVPCADWYMQMLEYARDKLRGYFYFNIPDFEVWRAVSDKWSFRTLLSKLSINTPRSALVGSGKYASAFAGVSPPYVLKASDSTEYWKFGFPGMKKVYFPESEHEVREICDKIEGSGYGGKIILEEEIGTREKRQSLVLTTYSSREGRVVRAVLGRVLLEEHGDTSYGNYSAIVTEPLTRICEELIAMLDRIGYKGIANFDIIEYEGKSWCLELNPRQGRSCDYLRGAGVNLAGLLISDMRGEKIEKAIGSDEIFWRCAPLGTVKRYAKDRELLRKAERLRNIAKEYTPFSSGRDKFLLRRAYLFLHSVRQRISLLKSEGRGENAT